METLSQSCKSNLRGSQVVQQDGKVISDAPNSDDSSGLPEPFLLLMIYQIILPAHKMFRSSLSFV